VEYYRDHASFFMRDGDPVWVASVSSTEEIALDPPAPFGIKVYPNPFNPITQISIWSDNSDYVDLRIFDLKGRLVYQWGFQELSAGENSFTWDGCDILGSPLPSGQYLLKANGAKGTTTKKLVLEK
jgi:hypothetical protein